MLDEGKKMTTKMNAPRHGRREGRFVEGGEYCLFGGLEKKKHKEKKTKKGRRSSGFKFGV